MNPFEVILNSVLPVFLLIGAGFGYSRLRTMDVRSLVDFIIDVAVPCLILARFSETPPSGGDIALIAAGAATVILGGITMTAVSLRFRLTRTRSAYLTAPFANAVNIPVPLALFAFGSAGVTNQLAYAVTNLCLMYILGIWLVLGNRQGLGRVLRMPPIWAMGVAMLLSFFDLSLPEFILRPVDLVGNTVAPLLLFALGYQLSAMGLGHVKEAALPVAVRMGGGLMLGLLFVALVSPSQAVARAVILGSPMPPAIQTYLLSAKLETDPEVAASGVVLGTLIAAVMIPILVPLIVMYV